MLLHRGADRHPICRFLRSLWFASTPRLQHRHERALPSSYAHIVSSLSRAATPIRKIASRSQNLLQHGLSRIHLLIFCRSSGSIPIEFRYVPMPESRTELMRGTLDLLILRALILNRDHGVGIARRIHQISKGTFAVKPGSLFPALHRLEEKGWLSSEWGESENLRRAKYYKLTKAGRKQIQKEMANWERVSTAMAWAIEATSEG
jgi:PadR family transcriptional regulator PadR